MKKFSKSFYGYNPDEVNVFLDSVISQVEKIINESKTKDILLSEKDKTILELQNTVNRYKGIESTLNHSIISAQEQTDRIRQLAKQESDILISESRKNANRIISDALNRAEKVQYNAEILKKNIALFKKKVRIMLEQQLELVDELEIIDID